MPSPLRILYHFRSRGTGAEAVHIAGIAGAFQRMGHEVSFESPTGVDPLETRGTSPFQRKSSANWLNRLVDRCPGWLFECLEITYNWVAAFRVRNWIRRGEIDLLYERHAFFLCSPAVIAHRHKVPMILEVNELVGDERIRAQPLLSWVARWTDEIAFRNASLIAVVSPHLQRRVVSLGIPAGKVVVVPNAVNPEDYPLRTDVAEAKRLRGFRTEDVLLGFVGWFVPWHQLDRLLQCFAQVSDEFPQASMVLVGEGELEPQLRALCADLNLTDRVRFLGAIPHREIPEVLAAMDVCLVPQSNPYRSPIKLFEYLASGKAVVAPRTEPIASVVEDGEHALLFDPASADELTQVLRRVLSDPPLRERLGKSGRDHVLRHHTWQHNAECLLEHLSRIDRS
jgi:glycosyltransferase involved in cell wall biosynthesis